MHMFFLSLTLAAGISGLLLYGLNRHPLFKLYRRPPSQHLKFITARLQQVLCVVVWSVTAMLPLSVAFASLGTGSTLAELLPYLLGMCLLIFLLNPKMQLPTTPDLVFTPSLFTASVNIHLTRADQPFTRSTYRQLSLLLDTLPRHGIHSVVMASPMFYYSDGTLRSLELLERTIQRVGGTLHDKPVPWWGCLVGKIVMCQKRFNKEDSPLDKLNLSCWHQITVTIQPSPRTDDIQPVEN